MNLDVRKVPKVQSGILFWFLFFLSAAPTAESLRAELTQQHETQCRRGDTAYEVYLLSSFDLSTNSPAALLVSRKIEIVPAIRVAASKADAKNGKFIFTIEYDYFATKNPSFKKPELVDMAVVAAGQNHSIEVSKQTLVASTIPRPGSSVLTNGKYWVELQISTLPEFLWFNDQEVGRYRNEWRSTGLLVDGRIWTEPFPVEIKLDPDAKSCQP